MRKVFLLNVLLVFLLSSCTSSYTIIFESKGGTDVDSLTVEEGKTISVPVVSREGYTLEGWYTSVNGGVTLDEKWSFANSIVRNDLTLYANWTINQYTITYDSDGGSSVAPITRDYNSTINTPADPSREGYTFAGWNQTVPSVMPAENLTIQAKWTINQYTISFDSDGGSSVNPITQDYSSNVIAPTEPTREGYIFSGWSEPIPSVMPAENVILIANWSLLNYSITYNLNNGNNNINNPNIFNITSNIELLEPVKIGHTFQGWFKDSTYTISYDNIKLGTIGDLTLYALWEVNQYTITFDTDGGTNVSSIKQDYNTSITIPTNPSKEGHTFLGWDITLPEMMPPEDLTLKALWEVNQYTITFDTDGGTNVSSIKQDYNTSITIPTNPSKEGHTFLWWDITLPEMMPPEDLTLKALWEVNQYELNLTIFDVNYSENKTILNFEEELLQIEYGVEHYAVLTSQGRLFTWGRNDSGQLGNGSFDDSNVPIDITSLFELKLNEKIIKIRLGGWHSAILTSEGRLFTWGNNDHGQLGIGNIVNKNIPTDITEKFNLSDSDAIFDFSLGNQITGVITNEGEVFTFGSSLYGGLGFLKYGRQIIPYKINESFELNQNEKIISLKLGNYSGLAVSSHDRIFTWGRNHSGQLGNGSFDDSNVPIDVTSEFDFLDGEKIIDADMRSHAIILTSLGRVFTWGRNLEGQLGYGTFNNSNTPLNITNQFNLANDEKINKISIGTYSSLVLSSQNRIFTFGISSQLGVNLLDKTNSNIPIDVTKVFLFDEDEKIVDASVGSYNSGLITNFSKYFFWGSFSESKNCSITDEYNNLPITTCFVNTISRNKLTIDYGSQLEIYLLQEYDVDKINDWYLDLNFISINSISIMPSHELFLYTSLKEEENNLIFITLTELSSFDGKDGANAYIAYNGVIYDVTNNPNWPNGVHRGYINAGQDVTQLFQTAGASHDDSNITNLPIVGYLEEE